MDKSKRMMVSKYIDEITPNGDEKCLRDSDGRVMCFECGEDNYGPEQKRRMPMMSETSDKINQIVASTRVTTRREVLQRIRKYLIDLYNEWRAMSNEQKYHPANMQVYNHIRTELDDLDKLAEEYGIDLDQRD